MSFSVLMSVYCGETPEYLEACLQSLADQKLKADEVVLVEDGLITSKLKDVIDSYRDSLNIVSVLLPKNLGLAEALNAGLLVCKHDLVARMDSDDIALPLRFRKQVDFMKSHQNITACGSYVEEFGDGLESSIRMLPVVNSKIVKFARRRSPLRHSATIFRRSVILEIGSYPNFRNCQDYALWTLLINNGYKLSNIPEVLLRMRMNKAIADRRGIKYFFYEAKVLKFQRDLGFLDRKDFIVNLTLRFFLRASPLILRGWLYRVIS